MFFWLKFCSPSFFSFFLSFFFFWNWISAGISDPINDIKILNVRFVLCLYYSCDSHFSVVRLLLWTLYFPTTFCSSFLQREAQARWNLRNCLSELESARKRQQEQKEGKKFEMTDRNRSTQMRILTERVPTFGLKCHIQLSYQKQESYL